MAGRDGGNAVAGGLARHIPVLAQQALELSRRPRRRRLYRRHVRRRRLYARDPAAADCSVIGIDRDQSAIARGADLVEPAKGRLTLVEDRFSALDRSRARFGYDAVDGVVLDLGVSSMQLDEAERGFSFRLDGPLDMRMGSEGPSAADVVAQASERDLADIISMLGEERHSRARRARDRRGAQRAADRHHHGAGRHRRARGAGAAERRSIRRRGRSRRCASSSTRSWPNWRAALAAAERILKPGGRLVVVTFHSLEDRIVKTFLAERSRTVGVLAPSARCRARRRRPSAC